MGRLTDTVNTLYDHLMYRPRDKEYYGESDFYNYGYWLKNTRSQKEACENLTERLLAYIPEKSGTILDVACGMGATTKHLLLHYSAANVVGINISAKQLETSRINAPGCEFILMNAVDLAFGDAAFDNLMCVEAAFHLDTRERFAHEAYRVLKPGGHLVLSDIIFARLPGIRKRRLPAANFVKDLEEYRDIYSRAGFREVEVVDATNECWRGFRRRLIRWGCQKFLKGEITVRDAGNDLLGLLLLSIIVRHYLLVSARKI